MMAKKKSIKKVLDYTGKDIEDKDFRWSVMNRPGVHLGLPGKGDNILCASIRIIDEMVDNAMDELKAGFGKVIVVKADEHSVTIRDFGRGVPHSALQRSFDRPNTGGKYTKKGAYKGESMGTNGLGGKIANFLCDLFSVKSTRNGKAKKIIWEKGIKKSEKTVSTTKKNGTLIKMVPNRKIFKGHAYRKGVIVETLSYLCYVNPQLKIKFKWKEEKAKVIHFPKGLHQLLLDEKYSPLYAPVILEGEYFELCFAHVDSTESETHSFVNSKYTLEHGTHVDKTFEVLMNIIKKNSKNVYKTEHLKSAFWVATSMRYVGDVLFDGQNKNKINMDVGFFADEIQKKLEEYFTKNKKALKSLLKMVENNKKASESSKEMRKKIRAADSALTGALPKKLTRCRKTGKGTMIFLVEGDSAGKTFKNERDNLWQAVFSMKGKNLNVMKATPALLKANVESRLVNLALFGMKDITAKDDYMKKLKYEKVIISADADAGGIHIELLMMTYFLKLYPKIIEEGRLYVFKSPLYKISKGKKVRYAMDDEHKPKVLKEMGANTIVSRLKGLGEFNDEDLAPLIAMNALSIERVPWDPKFKKILEFYMSDNTEQRRELVLGHIDSYELQ